MKSSNQSVPHIVVIGGGFCGLYLAKRLGNKPCRVTLIDKRNVHLFQPLLYQVATGGLSPGDITSPLRGVLAKYSNISVVMAEVTQINPDKKNVELDGGGQITYDKLVVAAGAQNFFFGNDGWEKYAPGLKSVEDALEIRRRVLLAFEGAELRQENRTDDGWLTFVVIGGGPTGVELAGAIGELAHRTLRDNFRNFDPVDTKIILLEGSDQVLGQFPPNLIESSMRELEKLGVEVHTHSIVTEITAEYVVYEENGVTRKLATRTPLWAAGVQPSALAKIVAERCGADVTPRGQIKVDPHLRVSGHPDIYVGGDLAYVENDLGKPVPGVAPSAMQMGKYIADSCMKTTGDDAMPPFAYVDKGSLAVIGRFAAVAHVGRRSFRGLTAWLLWALVHILYLIEFDNKIVVLFQWATDFLTRKRGARFISGEQSHKEIA